MVVFDDKNFIYRPEYPDSDFTGGDALYIVADDTELAAKIYKYAPYFDFIIDEDGKLVDVVPTEVPVIPVIPPLTVDDLAVAITEVAEQQQKDKIETDLALAELAEMIIAGGI